MSVPNPAPVWHLITGEYPPDMGGVSDHTALFALELAAIGREVHVWTRGTATDTAIETGGVRVHRIAGRFGPLSLWRMGQALNRQPNPRRLFVQYVPNAYGWKALNLPFAIWIWLRRRLHGDDVRTMFHEVCYPWVRRPLRHNIIAAVTRVMAAFVTRASTRCYLSTPAWEPMLRSISRSKVAMTWLPVPANVATVADPEAVTAFRAMLPAGPVIAHFGTYGHHIESLLTPTWKSILTQHSTAVILLLGRSSDTYRERFVKIHPEWAGRIIATGSLASEQVAVALRAADVALQPYPEGVCTRRGSVMAVLANGVPLVTTLGSISESFWKESGLIVSTANDPAALSRMTLDLIQNRSKCVRIGQIAKALYEDRFTLRKIIEALLQDGG